MTGWDVNEEFLDVSLGYRFEVIGDGVDMPSPSKRCFGFYNRPGLSNEVSQGGLRQSQLHTGYLRRFYPLPHRVRQVWAVLAVLEPC